MEGTGAVETPATQRLRGAGVACAEPESGEGDSAGVKNALLFAVLLRLARVRRALDMGLFSGVT